MIEISLRELQLAELEILMEFDRFCRENQLRYSLAGGTLLGAIRHKGFIPWDDDIDVCMPRPDYEKFVRLFQNHRFMISEDRGNNAEYPFTKVMRRDVKLQHEGFSEVDYLWIDVFPIDGLPADGKKLAKIYRKSSFYRKIIGFKQIEKVKEYKGRHNKFVARLIVLFAKLYGKRRAIRNSIKLARRYDYEESEYVGAVTWGCYGVGERMLKCEYETFTEVEFEGRKFFAMSCRDSYLRGIYGEYMKLPLEEERMVHGFKAYRLEEEQ